MSREIELTDANFDQTIADSKLPILVDFWAPWCGPCRFVGPILTEMAEEMSDKLLIGKLNVDDNQAIAGKFGVSSIPTMIVFKNGEKVDQIIGAMAKPALIEAVSKHL